MSQDGGDRAHFLRASRDIEYVKANGRRTSTPWFNVLVCRVEWNVSRVGIVVGKRFGMAVQRNRAKRLFRELSRHVRADFHGGYGLLVFPKRDALSVSFETLEQGWISTLRRLGVLRSRER